MIFIALILDVLAYHGFIAMLSDHACEKTIRPKFAAPQLFLDLWATPEYLSRRHALQHSHNLRRTMLVPTEPENEHDPCPSLSPKISFGSDPQFPNIPLSKPHQPCHQTLLVGTLPEIPSGTSAPLRYGSYGYIRSSTKLTPQAAGNSTRKDYNGTQDDSPGVASTINFPYIGGTVKS